MLRDDGGSGTVADCCTCYIVVMYRRPGTHPEGGVARLSLSLFLRRLYDANVWSQLSTVQVERVLVPFLHSDIGTS